MNKKPYSYCREIQRLLLDGWKRKKSNGHYLFLKKDGETIKVALATGTIVKKDI